MGFFILAHDDYSMQAPGPKKYRFFTMWHNEPQEEVMTAFYLAPHPF